MTSHPLISVLLAVHNGQSYVEQALRSVLHQSHDDFEIIVVDDESTDRTPQILSALQQRDHRLRVERRRHSGLTSSLNFALQLARSPYIARLDADDTADPTRLAKQLAFLEETDSVAVVGSGADLIDEGGRLRKTIEPPRSPESIARALQYRNVMIHSSVMARRSVVLEVGAYRDIMVASQDYDLWLRMSESHSLANLPEPLVKIRWHPRQISSHHLKEQVVCQLAARASARLRRAGMKDPLHGASSLTPDVLAQLGLSERQVAEALVAAYSERISEALAYGFFREAESLALSLQSVRWVWTWRGRRAAERNLALGRLLLSSRFRIQRLVRLALASLEWPPNVVRLVRAVITRRSNRANRVADRTTRLRESGDSGKPPPST